MRHVTGFDHNYAETAIKGIGECAARIAWSSCLKATAISMTAALWVLIAGITDIHLPQKSSGISTVLDFERSGYTSTLPSNKTGYTSTTGQAIHLPRLGPVRKDIYLYRTAVIKGFFRV
eukprot:246790-Amphidinium_carterae.1